MKTLVSNMGCRLITSMAWKFYKTNRRIHRLFVSEFAKTLMILFHCYSTIFILVTLEENLRQSQHIVHCDFAENYTFVYKYTRLSLQGIMLKQQYAHYINGWRKQRAGISLLSYHTWLCDTWYHPSLFIYFKASWSTFLKRTTAS